MVVDGDVSDPALRTYTVEADGTTTVHYSISVTTADTRLIPVTVTVTTAPG